jgi:hypothetical protein
MVVSKEWVNEHQKVVAVAKDTEVYLVSSFLTFTPAAMGNLLAALLS